MIQREAEPSTRPQGRSAEAGENLLERTASQVHEPKRHRGRQIAGAGTHQAVRHPGARGSQPLETQNTKWRIRYPQATFHYDPCRLLCERRIRKSSVSLFKTKGVT